VQRLVEDGHRPATSGDDYDSEFLGYLYFSAATPLGAHGNPPSPVMFVEMHMKHSGQSLTLIIQNSYPQWYLLSSAQYYQVKSSQVAFNMIVASALSYKRNTKYCAIPCESRSYWCADDRLLYCHLSVCLSVTIQSTVTKSSATITTFEAHLTRSSAIAVIANRTAFRSTIG